MKKSDIELPHFLRSASQLVVASLSCLALWALPSYAYERIVSATGNASEIIAELGLADKLVAVDTTSLLPAEVMANKPKIGYRRALSAEGILSMQPDLLVLAPDAGPPAVIKQLQAASVPSVTISDVKTVAGVIDDIEMLAEKLAVTSAAQALIEGIRSDEKTLKATIADYPRAPKVAFLMDSGMGGALLMALGDKTAGNAMIRLVGGENVFNAFNSVKPASAESLASTDMDVIIIASHGKAALKSDIKTADKPDGAGINATEQIVNVTTDYPSLSLTKAGKNGCIFRIGILQSLGFGPSFSQAANDIAGVIKPCLRTKTQ